MLCSPVMRSVAEVKSITIIAVLSKASLWELTFEGFPACGEVWCQPGKPGFMSSASQVLREELKLLFVGNSSAELWKEQLCSYGRRVGTRSEPLERAKRKQTMHALPVCICMHVHMQVGLWV